MSAISRNVSLWALAAFLAASSLVGCATTDDSARSKTRSERLASKQRSGKNDMPKHYGIYKQKDLDMQLLRRGQRARQSPSLDSY